MVDRFDETIAKVPVRGGEKWTDDGEGDFETGLAARPDAKDCEFGDHVGAPEGPAQARPGSSGLD